MLSCPVLDLARSSSSTHSFLSNTLAFCGTTYHSTLPFAYYSMPKRSNHASLPLLSRQLSQLHCEDKVTMVSSVEVPPIITGSADPIDGGADLGNQYLNDDVVSSGQRSSSPMQSSRGLTPSSEGRQRSSTNASQNGGNHKENRNLDDNKGAGDGLKQHRGTWTQCAMIRFER